MRLDSVRELKASLNETIIKPMAASPVARAALGMAAQPMATAGAGGPTMALVFVRKSNQDYYLAVRLQRRGLENSTQLDTIKKKAKGEVDVRYIGRVLKFATPCAAEPDPAAQDRCVGRPFQDHRRHARLLRPGARRQGRQGGDDPLEQPRAGQREPG